MKFFFAKELKPKSGVIKENITYYLRVICPLLILVCIRVCICVAKYFKLFLTEKAKIYIFECKTEIEIVESRLNRKYIDIHLKFFIFSLRIYFMSIWYDTDIFLNEIQQLVFRKGLVVRFLGKSKDSVSSFKHSKHAIKQFLLAGFRKDIFFNR